MCIAFRIFSKDDSAARCRHKDLSYSDVIFSLLVMNIILRRDPVLIYINRSMWTLSYNDKDNAEILSPWGVSGCANNLGRPNDCANCFVLTKRHVICVICVYSDIKMNIRVGNKWCISLWTENYLILCFAALTWPSSWEPMICIPEDLELQNTMLWSACTG